MNKNQHRGFVAHKRGIDFEAEVERTNSDLFLEGIGRVYKGHMECFYYKDGLYKARQKGVFDWYGILHGVPVYFETKRFMSNNKTKMPATHTLDDKCEHQIRALREMNQFSNGKAHCFVLCDWQWDNGTELVAEMRLHPVSAVDGLTLIRELSVHAQDRVWSNWLFTDEYKVLAAAGVALKYKDESEVPL